MATSTDPKSADIIQFPAGGRAGYQGRRLQPTTAPEYGDTRVVISGGAWYHEEAVRDTNRANNS